MKRKIILLFSLLVILSCTYLSANAESSSSIKNSSTINSSSSIDNSSDNSSINNFADGKKALSTEFICSEKKGLLFTITNTDETKNSYSFNLDTTNDVVFKVISKNVSIINLNLTKINNININDTLKLEVNQKNIIISKKSSGNNSNEVLFNIDSSFINNEISIINGTITPELKDSTVILNASNTENSIASSNSNSGNNTKNSQENLNLIMQLIIAVLVIIIILFIIISLILNKSKKKPQINNFNNDQIPVRPDPTAFGNRNGNMPTQRNIDVKLEERKIEERKIEPPKIESGFNSAYIETIPTKVSISRPNVNIHSPIEDYKPNINNEPPKIKPGQNAINNIINDYMQKKTDMENFMEVLNARYEKPFEMTKGINIIKAGVKPNVGIMKADDIVFEAKEQNPYFMIYNDKYLLLNYNIYCGEKFKVTSPLLSERIYLAFKFIRSGRNIDQSDIQIDSKIKRLVKMAVLIKNPDGTYKVKEEGIIELY